MKSSERFAELSAAQLRQYIDAEAVFSALEDTKKNAAEVRGSMFWRTQGEHSYLIRASAAGAQTSWDLEARRPRQSTRDLSSANAAPKTG